VEPGDRSLDDPAGFAQPAAVRLAATSDLGSYASGMQWLAILIVVVSPIALDDARLEQRATALAADWWNCLDQWQQLGDVVTVGASQYQRQWNALGVGQEVVL